ncbi:MAG TPA: putative sulfate exporter family transporter [Bacillales bacterium]
MKTETSGNAAFQHHTEPVQRPDPSPWLLWWSGIGFTMAIAFIGYGVAQIPGPDRVGSMACSIILAVIYRQIWGYPKTLKAGIDFSGKKLLRYAIVLYGLKLNIDIILNQGLPLLARDAFTVAFAIVLTVVIAKWMKADVSLSLLLGIGTGVCGASAIAAASPIVKAKEEDTAIGVGIIALMGTVFALIYTVIRPLLPLSGMEYGIWSGVSLHEIAHVALAAAPAGQDPLAVALLAKLGRVFLLVPLSFVLILWMKKRSNGKMDAETKTSFPWFLVGFVIMSLIGSYIIGDYVKVPHSVLSGIGNLSHFILTAAMVGLGLNVSFKALRTKALRPLITMTIVSIFLSGVTFLSMLFI